MPNLPTVAFVVCECAATVQYRQTDSTVLYCTVVALQVVQFHVALISTRIRKAAFSIIFCFLCIRI